MFLENFKSIFCFQDADFVSSTYVVLWSKRGITWETLKEHWLSMFPEYFLVCVPKQHILKTRNLCLGSKNVLLLSCLLTYTTLWATLTQNDSAAMLPRLRRPLETTSKFLVICANVLCWGRLLNLWKRLPRVLWFSWTRWHVCTAVNWVGQISEKGILSNVPPKFD